MPEAHESDPFSAHVVAAVVAHMVEDHADDTLAIARAHAGARSAVAARVTDLSARGVAIAVTHADGSSAEALVPWQEVPRDRRAIRTELVRMTEEAAPSADGPQPAE